MFWHLCAPCYSSTVQTHSPICAVDAVFSVCISSVAALCHFTACTSRQAWLLSHLSTSASPWLLRRDSQACFSHRGTNASLAKKSPNLCLQSVSPIGLNSTVSLAPKPPQKHWDIMKRPLNCSTHIPPVSINQAAMLIIIVIYGHYFQQCNTKTISYQGFWLPFVGLWSSLVCSFTS